MEGQSSPRFYIISLLFLATGFGCLHMFHVSTIFENDRHFSHLSEMEREMTFRTEMGFYYNFYKKLVLADSFREGLNLLLKDNMTQYPLEINAVQQYNLLPEITIAGLFKLFDKVTSAFRMKTKTCWLVDRGPGLSSITSCDGLGDPMHFYLHVVWLCAGISIAILFLYSVFLSDSVAGGLLAVLGFLYNHSNCTRVQWTPPLRESFGYPACLLQMFAVSYCLRFHQAPQTKINFIIIQMLSISLCTMASLVLWQFSQFVLATQTTILLLMYCGGMLHKHTFLLIASAQLVGLVQAWIALFGNEFLVQSLMFTVVLSSIMIVSISEPKLLPDFNIRSCLILISLSFLMAFIKATVSLVYADHDAHIMDILISKLTSHRTFHSMLYTCSPEFDWMPYDTWQELTQTGLVPCVCLVCILSVYRFMKYTHVVEQHSDVLYNLLQLAVFTLMATGIMRLKVFSTPHMCIVSSLLTSSKMLPSLAPKVRSVVLVAVVAAMSYIGIQNVLEQRKVIGQYSNVPLENTLTWITQETNQGAVFAGPMGDMANVWLSTGRPIVNNPHYEHVQMRERTMKVYSLFSRRSAAQVYSTLLSMGVDYVLLNRSWCFRTRGSCSLVDIWDLFDQKNLDQPELCQRLFSGDSTPFHRVFQNQVYAILALRHHPQHVTQSMPQFQM